MGQQVRVVRRSFNGGEIGPQLAMRSELEPYKKSCLTLNNFLPTPYGTIQRRPGMRWRTWLNSRDAVREFPFQYNDQTVYRVAVLANGTFTVMRAGGDFNSISGQNALVFSSDAGLHSYTAAMLPEIYYFQSGDVIFMFHTGHPPMRIERHADDDWRMTEHRFIGGPMLQGAPAGELVTETVDYTITAVEYADYQVINHSVVPSWGGPYVNLIDGADDYEDYIDIEVIGSLVYSRNLRLTIGEHSIAAGETVEFSGLNTDWNGVWTITRIGYDWIEISTDATREEEHRYYPAINVQCDGYGIMVQQYSDVSTDSVLSGEKSLAGLPGEGKVREINYLASSQDAGFVSLNLRPKEHGKDGPYSVGDVVVPPGSALIAVTGVSRSYWYEQQIDSNEKNVFYYLNLLMTGHSFAVGDSVYLYGMGAPFDGPQTVLRVLSNAISIDSRVRDKYRYGSVYGWYWQYRYYQGVKVADFNDYSGAGSLPPANIPALPTITADSKAQKSAWAQTDLFRCIVRATDADGLPGAGVNENTYWRRVSAASGEMLATATSGVFHNSDVGRKIRASRLPPTKKGTFTAEGSESKPIPCSGEITLTTREGAWTGTLGLYESTDGGETWSRRGKIEAQNADYNGTITRSASSLQSLWKVVMDSYTAATGQKCCWVLEPVVSISDVYGTISQVISPLKVKVLIDTPVIESLTTTDWSLGATGGVYGWPAFGFIQDERLVIAGIPGDPAKVYCSMTNDWSRFDIAQLATSPFSFILPSAEAERLVWGLSKTYMVFGSTTGEWVVKPRDAGAGYSFENIKIEQISRIGSAPIQPVMQKDTVFFFGADRKTLWAMAYEYEKDELYPKQADILAPHLPESEAVMLCTTSTPWPVIWVLDSAGKIYALLYDQANNVIAWSKQNSFSLTGWGPRIVSLISVRKGGASMLLAATKDYGVQINKHWDEFYEMPLEGENVQGYDVRNRGGLNPGTQVLTFDRIISEMEPTLLTQDEESINGGSTWKAAALDLFVVNSTNVEVWISGMPAGTWQSQNMSFNYTGRVRIRLPAAITQDFRLKIRAGETPGHFELAALAVNFERTNSEVV